MNITFPGSFFLNQNYRKYPLALIAAALGIILFGSLILWFRDSIQLPGGNLTQEALPVTAPAESETLAGESTLNTPRAQTASSPSSTPDGAKDLGSIGAFQQGGKVEISLPWISDANQGVPTDGSGIRVDVTFTGPEGKVLVVPGFYDGDGSGGQEGNLWKVRFSTNVPGEWSFVSSSPTSGLNGYEGVFQIEPAAGCLAEKTETPLALTCLGTLTHTGGHYLRFSNGDYWIKGGVDDPENFLGNAIGDWNAKKDALDFLSSKGVNSIYVITNNIDGDDNDTWPWVGSTPQQAKQNSNQFNSAKLQQWEDFFTYAESKGIVLHIVLNDDSAWTGYNHQLYYSEMVARFGHHPGLIWNIGEEANEVYSNAEQIENAQLLRSLDPYDHPITVHRKSPWPFLGNSNFDLTSIQFGDGAQDFSTANLKNLNEVVISHREDSAVTCQPIPVMIDELARVTTVNESTLFKLRSQVLYPIYFGGGNYEIHYLDAYGQGGKLTFQQLAPMLEDMQRARQFLEGLPFNQMTPCNDLLSGGNGYCFGKNGEVYAVYLLQGGQFSVDLTGIAGNFKISWFNPRTGLSTDGESVAGGGTHNFSPPDNQDWVLLLDNPLASGDQATVGGGINPLASLDQANLLAFKVYLPALLQCGG